MDPRTPNLFLIGVPKAGTTLVHHALGLVDGVYMSEVKEPGFFTSRDYARGIGFYLDAYFARAAGDAVRGESTPWYLYSPAALARIAQLPTVEPPKFVVTVRRPSDRAVSMYRDQVRIKRESRSFEQAISEELAGLARGVLAPDIRRRYVWCSRYAEHIDRWRDEFGADRVHVAVFEDITASPKVVWDDLSEFLGIDLGVPRFDDVSERDRNPSGSLRWPRLDATIRSFEGRDSKLVERAKRVLPPGMHRRILQRIGRMNRTPESVGLSEVDPTIRARIDDACAESTARVEALLDRPLPEWTT